MFSAIVPEMSSASCSTTDTLARSESSAYRRTSTPSIVTRPLTGSLNRFTSVASVVFPAPDGPTIATSSPGLAVKVTSSSTGLAP